MYLEVVPVAKGNVDWRAPALGEARAVEVRDGRLRAHVSGEGPAVVFVHGALVNANLWRKVVPRLEGCTRVALDLPLGSHLDPIPARELTPPDLAALIGEAVEALGLRDVTLVGNDTGGALCQIAAAARPAWLGRLVLTTCDAFEHFPPPALRPFVAAMRVPGVLPALFAPLRIRPLRRLPNAYSLAVHGRIEDEVLDSYVLPMLTDRAIRRDLRRAVAGVHRRHTLAAAERLRSFDRPALIAWSADDRFFPRRDATRLAETIPGARLEWIEGASTFPSEDRPDRLAELIGDFVREPVESPA
jgi:pimeloyl-ACP methyl ester carboxylesterase